MKLTLLLVAKPEFVTVTVLVLSVAVGAIVNVAVTAVPVPFTAMLPTVTPVPETVIELTPVKLVPLSVTETGCVPLRLPDVGLIDVRVGLRTVNTCVFVVPPLPFGVATPIVLLPAGAAPPMTNVAVICESFTTVKLLTVKLAPSPLRPVAPVRSVPLRVIGTLVPATPEVGLIEVVVAPVTVKARVFVNPPFAFGVATPI